MSNQIIFYATLVLVLFIPGYFILLSVFRKSKKFSLLEELAISFGLSILAVDFLMIFLERLDIPLNRLSLLVSVIALCAICYAIYRKRRDVQINEERDFGFTSLQTYLIVLILFLSFFIRASYLEKNMLPSATDLGHHMYWAKKISLTGSIPDYQARDIVSTENGYAITPPLPISDFIVGEHLIFSAINLISGIDFISYFPVIVLHLINLMSLLALFILALRLFEDWPSGRNVAILALFFIGPLFAAAPPQAKYVAGGVVGNLLGNFLLPLTFYFYYRTLKEKSRLFLATAIFFSMGLFYTHHLTALLFLLVFSLIILLVLILHFRELPSLIRSWSRLVFSLPVLAILFFAVIFVIFIYAPTYLTNQAVSTVVGGPAKIEHTGLTFSQFKFNVGEPRIAFGLAGLAILGLLSFSIFKRKGYAEIFLFSWIFFILLISLEPSWLGLSIPSSRIANYGTYPLSIIGAMAFVEIVKWAKEKEHAFSVNRKLFLSSLIFLATLAVISGFYDNSQYSTNITDAQKTVQTFAASRYLSEKMNDSDQILTDHVYLTSDSWIKLFLMRDYNFPFYRAVFSRYTNGIDKEEQCTLWMVSTPNSADAQKCFSDLSIDFVMIDKTDASQFGKSSDFWQIYNNGQIKTFYRPENN